MRDVLREVCAQATQIIPDLVTHPPEADLAHGLLAPELASGITRAKGVATKSAHLGNWLTAKQAQALLNAPKASTPKGLRDRAILAVLLGGGLRRSEAVSLTIGHIQQRDVRCTVISSGSVAGSMPYCSHLGQSGD